MSATATQDTPQDDPGPHAPDTRGHGAALDNLISMGTGIARLLHDQAHAQAAQQAAALAPQATDGQPAPQATAAQPAPAPAPAPAASLQDLAAAFDSISRTVRRCIMLAQSLDTPKQPARTPAPSHTAAPPPASASCAPSRTPSGARTTTTATATATPPRRCTPNSSTAWTPQTSTGTSRAAP